MTSIQLVTLLVENYDDAIEYFVQRLGFDLVEDSAAVTTDGRSKRWVVVRPHGATTGILLAQVDGDEQIAALGRQVGDRVGFFLEVDEFERTYETMVSSGVTFVSPPRTEPYGTVAVFRDISGNRWDLICRA